MLVNVVDRDADQEEDVEQGPSGAPRLLGVGMASGDVLALGQVTLVWAVFSVVGWWLLAHWSACSRKSRRRGSS